MEECESWTGDTLLFSFKINAASTSHTDVEDRLKLNPPLKTLLLSCANSVPICKIRFNVHIYSVFLGFCTQRIHFINNFLLKFVYERKRSKIPLQQSMSDVDASCREREKFHLFSSASVDLPLKTQTLNIKNFIDLLPSSNEHNASWRHCTFIFIYK